MVIRGAHSAHKRDAHNSTPYDESYGATGENSMNRVGNGVRCFAHRVNGKAVRVRRTD